VAEVSPVKLIGRKPPNSHPGGRQRYGRRSYPLPCVECDTGEYQAAELVITPADESEVTVDSNEVAQFTHLMLHNQKIRDLSTPSSKAVLSPERRPERSCGLEFRSKDTRTGAS